MTQYVFRASRKVGGRRVRRRLYSGRYQLDGMEFSKTVALGTTDKGVAEKRLRDLIVEAQSEAVGLLAPKAAREAAAMPLDDHLDLYMRELRQGVSVKHLENTEARLRRLFRETGWKVLSDITPRSFLLWRSKQGNKSPATLNQYRERLSAFLRSPLLADVLPRNPLGQVQPLPTDGHAKRKRRALTDDEMRALLNVSGPHSLQIRLMYWAGLRRGEALRLLWDDVKLDASPPTVRLPAAITKNGKTSVQVLGDLVGELASLRGQATDEEPVFANGVISMREWKRLLKAAGIPYLDGQGRQADVHALRYTLCTNLARAGVAVQTAMAIMRHNDVKLTTRIYLDAGQLPRSDAMALVPSFALAEVDPRSHGRSHESGIGCPAMSQADTGDRQADPHKAVDFCGELHEMAQSGTDCQRDVKTSPKATLFISSLT